MSLVINFFILLQVVILPLIFYTPAKDHFIVKDVIFHVISFSIVLFYFAGLFINKTSGKRLGSIYVLGITAFLLILVLSFLNAAYWVLSARVFLTYMFYCMTAVVVAQGVDSGTIKTVVMIRTIICASAIVASYGILQYLGIDFLAWQTSFGQRPGATFGNPNFSAGYIMLTLPLAVGVLVEGFVQKKRLGGTNIFMLVCAVLIAAYFFITRTRGAWLAFISGSVVVFFVYCVVYKKWRVAVLAGLVFCVLLTSMVLYGKKVFGNTDASVVERVFKWRTAMEMVRSNPLTGIGLGNLKVNFALYQARVRDKAGFKLRGTSESNVHNDYLQLAAEAGIPGLMGYLVMFSAVYIGVLHKLVSKESKKTVVAQNKFGLWFSLAAVVMFNLYSFNNFPLSIVPTGFIVFVLIGILVSDRAYCDITGDVAGNKKDMADRNTGFIGAGIAVITIFFAVFYGLPQIRAEVHRSNGDGYRNLGDYNSAAKEYLRALKLDYYRSEFTAYDLGMAYVKLGDYRSAIKAFETSVNLRNYGEVYNDIGNCYYLLGNNVLAAKNWEVALKLYLPNEEDQQQVLLNLARVKPKK
ncbi:MAG: O-antigen ligase family protein [Elusimicrobiota bacterium]